MVVRPSMAYLIAQERLMIADPASVNQQFTDQQIQDRLDANRDDVRYLQLAIAPSIVNTASTGNTPSTIYADYYSEGYQWWETDIVLQGNNINGAAWVSLTPVASDYIVGHFQFEPDVFNTGTVPGQVPPIFATGKIYDINAAAADLLEFWAVTLTGAYDFSSDGQSFKRSQLMQGKLTMAQYYRRQAKPKTAKMKRNDVMPELNSISTRLLEGDNLIKGR